MNLISGSTVLDSITFVTSSGTAHLDATSFFSNAVMLSRMWTAWPGKPSRSRQVQGQVLDFRFVPAGHLARPWIWRYGSAIDYKSVKGCAQWGAP